MGRGSSATFHLENIAVTLGLFDKAEWAKEAKEQDKDSLRFVLCVVVNGELEVCCQNERIFLQEQEVCLIQNDDRIDVSENGSGTSLYWMLQISCERNNLSNGMDYYRLLQNKWKQQPILLGKSDALSNVGYRCFRGILLQEPRTLQMAAYELILILLEETGQEFSVPDGRRREVNKIQPNTQRTEMISMLLRRSYYMDISLQDIANLLFLSVKQTNRILRKAFGKTWNVLLTEYRMKVALWLIGGGYFFSGSNCRICGLSVCERLLLCLPQAIR